MLDHANAWHGFTLKIFCVPVTLEKKSNFECIPFYIILTFINYAFYYITLHRGFLNGRASRCSTQLHRTLCVPNEQYQLFRWIDYYKRLNQFHYCKDRSVLRPCFIRGYHSNEIFKTKTPLKVNGITF